MKTELKLSMAFAEAVEDFKEQTGVELTEAQRMILIALAVAHVVRRFAPANEKTPEFLKRSMN